MRPSRVINVAAGIAIAASAVIVFLAANDPPPSSNGPRHAAIGRAMAQETLRHVKPGVGVVAIVRDSSAFKHPESDYQFRAFQQAIQQGGARIAAVQSLQLDPLRNLEVPPGDFFELIRKTPAGSAIVSFMGPPNLSPEQRARLGEIRPRIIAFCPGTIPRRIDLRDLFEAGLLHAAVIERADVPPRPGHSKTPGPAEWFEAHYRLVHATDAASLAEAGSATEAR